MKISAAIITALEPSLERAVASIRPHVDEVVAIVTVPADLDGIARCNSLFDRCEITQKFSYPDGEMADFGAARQASFALATGDAKLWLDSDDEVVGGENIRPTLEKFDPKARMRWLCRYEYLLDDEGRPLVEQWRERLVWGDQPYSWKRPVHEHLTADDGRNEDVRIDAVTWRHHLDDRPRSARNLRILLDHEKQLGEVGKKDPWLRLTLAQELRRAQKFREALEHYEAYVELSSRVDEKALACVEASECALALGPTSFDRQEDAIRWTREGLGHANDSGRLVFEPLFAQARILFVRGATSGDDKAMQEARDLVEEAIATEPAPTVHAIKPQDRATNAPELLRTICETQGDWAAAVKACDLLLAAKPGDAIIALQKRRYERLIAREAGGRVRASTNLGLDVVIACGPSIEPWNPKLAAERGIGGSETAVIEVAKRLVQMGHNVRVVTDCVEPAVYEGALWLPTPHMRDCDGCDVAIAWRNAACLDFFRNARARVMWAHDVNCHAMTPERALLCDRVFGLSEWHCERLRKDHGFHPAQMVRTRNGIDLSRFAEKVPRDPHRAIYSSSPDRGLPVLLDVWPRVLKRVPDAKLDVYYGFDVLEKVLEGSPRSGFSEMARFCIEQMKRRMGTYPGVTMHGRVDQKELARAMLGAGVWAYPTWFTETDCISAREAQAAGLRIVTSPIAALTETVGERGTLIEGDWLSAEYQDAFVEAVVDAMLREGDEDREANMAHAKAHFSWDGVVSDWLDVFDEVLEAAEFGCLPPYQPIES